jgi:hypothetical protein
MLSTRMQRKYAQKAEFVSKAQQAMEGKLRGNPEAAWKGDGDTLFRKAQEYVILKIFLLNKIRVSELCLPAEALRIGGMLGCDLVS